MLFLKSRGLVNAWVFEGKRVLNVEIVRKAISLIDEIEKAHESHQNFKINSDVACFKDGSLGLGGVVRDSMGDVRAATCVLSRGSESVEVVEALAARHALSIAIDAGLTRVELV
uniref:RNase H type-1 domain-containing protein n=1 Tax=Chenopodium quinoa TaxID=63459 RepID=A0A803N8M7_CHEQI